MARCGVCGAVRPVSGLVSADAAPTELEDGERYWFYKYVAPTVLGNFGWAVR